MDLEASGGKVKIDELEFQGCRGGRVQGNVKVTEERERALFNGKTQLEKGSTQVRA